MLKNNLSLSRGSGLVEVLVALGLIATLLMIAAGSVANTFRNTQQSKSNSQAALYAQQGLEVVRQMRTTGWNTFSTFNGTYCMAKSCTQLQNISGACGPKPGSGCGQNVDKFSREVIIDPNSTACGAATPRLYRVESVVYWSDNTCRGSLILCKKVSMQTCLGNINY